MYLAMTNSYYEQSVKDFQKNVYTNLGEKLELPLTYIE